MHKISGKNKDSEENHRLHEKKDYENMETPYGSIVDYTNHLRNIGVSEDQITKEIEKYLK